MTEGSRPRRLMVGITGATGAIYAVRLIDALRALEIESHVCVSPWGARTLEHETGLTVSDLRGRATAVYGAKNQAAEISSGSFVLDGAVIVPCTMRTLAAISHGLGDNLITRAVDVSLKEQRKVVLAVRETPLHTGHLENMLKASQLGAVIMPPVPSFYNGPQTLDDLVNYFVARVLDQFGWHVDERRWDGQLRRPADRVSSGS